VVGVALLSLAGAVLSPALADREDDLEDRQDHLSDQVHDARRDLDESSKRYARAASALDAAEGRLSEARRVLAHVLGQLEAARALDLLMQQRLAQAEQRLADAEADLDAAAQVVDDQQARIENFALRNYVNSDPGLISLNLVLSGQSPADLTSSLSAAESLVASQTADLDRLDASRIMLSLRQQRVEALRDDVALKRAEAADNLERKRELAEQARSQTQTVRVLVGERRILKDRARAAKEHDLRLLEQMESERERVRDQLHALALRQARANSSTPTTTTSTGDGGGFLSYPISGGYITSPYGMRMHPILHIYKLHDGTDFGAACGTPVYASASGTIVSAYYNAGYGNRVIMNHGIVNGVSLSTSYNHLTSFVAGVGQHVERGELIAYSGTTGYSTGCHLHFMVYVNGVTVDPMSWL
jgi:murein DD-endopeptidase MepM/ murein hydrolase activator NlpD